MERTKPAPAIFSSSASINKRATIDQQTAKWFALSNPNSPPAACFEFDLLESVLLIILQMNPPAAKRHGAADYEFMPASHGLLNQHMTNRQVIPVP